jgi:hypothetical protein
MGAYVREARKRLPLLAKGVLVSVLAFAIVLTCYTVLLAYADEDYVDTNILRLTVGNVSAESGTVVVPVEVVVLPLPEWTGIDMPRDPYTLGLYSLVLAPVYDSEALELVDYTLSYEDSYEGLEFTRRTHYRAADQADGVSSVVLNRDAAGAGERFIDFYMPGSTAGPASLTINLVFKVKAAAGEYEIGLTPYLPRFTYNGTTNRYTSYTCLYGQNVSLSQYTNVSYDNKLLGNSVLTTPGTVTIGGTVPPQPTTVNAVAGYGGTVIESSGGNYIVTPSVDGYVVDQVWVDGKEVNAVQGENSYTTTEAPERSVFATFVYASALP